MNRNSHAVDGNFNWCTVVLQNFPVFTEAEHACTLWLCNPLPWCISYHNMLKKSCSKSFRIELSVGANMKVWSRWENWTVASTPLGTIQWQLSMATNICKRWQRQPVKGTGPETASVAMVCFIHVSFNHRQNHSKVVRIRINFITEQWIVTKKVLYVARGRLTMFYFLRSADKRGLI